MHFPYFTLQFYIKFEIITITLILTKIRGAIMPMLKKTSLKAQVYEIIRQKILQQKYALGEKINIDTLAEELNISNSPIREALMMLTQDGLIEMVPNNGAKVISFSEEGFHEIASSLYVVLYGAYDLCIKLDVLDTVVAEMQQHIKQQKYYHETGNIPESVKYALLFDKCIVKATKNSYLISIYERMEDIFYLMALHSHQRGEDDRKNNIAEHDNILQSIRNRDTAAVHHWLNIHYDKHL